MRTIFRAVVCLLWVVSSKAQIAVPNTTPVTENFNGMGTTTALPSNWKISGAAAGTAATWTTATNATAVTATACANSPTAGGAYNFGVSAGCTDRYVGFMTSGGYGTTNCLMSSFQNTNAAALNSITLSYDVRKFRDNTGTFSLTLYYSTDGTTWTSAQTYTLAAGTNTYNQSAPPTATQTVSINLCVAPNSNFYLKWNFDTPGSSSSKGIGIDNFSLTASFVTSPTTASSSPVVSAIGCNSFQLTWTNGDGGNHLVVVSGSAISTMPSQGTTYTANSTYGLGTAIGSAYAVYFGSSNTVTITGLTPSSTYYFAIFETNGTTCYEYLVVSYASGSTTTTSCPTCPTLTGAILDACNSGCNEGDAEVMFFNTGTYSVSVSSLPTHVVNYYGGVSSYTAGTINAYTGTFASNSSVTSTLNSSTGCSGSFIDAASVGTIPAGATVMMVPNTFCSTNYDFSNICSSLGPIYVLYFGTTGWSSSGNLSNNQTPSPKPKYITVNFSSVSGSCAMQYYTFDADTEKNGDGAGIAYPGSISTNSTVPTSPNVYTSSTCTLPLVLPINLLSFTVVRTYTYEAELKFTTIAEENVRRFLLNKSYDGLHYYTFLQKEARNEIGTYSYTGFDEVDGSYPAIYYRLEEEDLDGTRKIIGNCVLPMNGGKEISYTFSDEAILLHSSEGIQNASLYTIEGALVASVSGSADKLEYTLSTVGCRPGFYMLYITDIYGKTAVKKVFR